MEINEINNVMKDFKDYSLLGHNTFGIDNKCARFVEFSTIDELQSFVRKQNVAACHFMVIGQGSNLLLTQDYDGIVLHSAIKGCELVNVADVDKNNVYLRCGSSEVWDDIVAYCVANGWHGIENLSLIPGEVGASAVQNIGAYGVEVKDVIYKVEAVDISTGDIVVFSNADCQYAYRQSRFKNDWKNKYFITNVTYRLSKSFNPNLDYGNIRKALQTRNIDNPTAEQLRQTIVEIRRAKLPDPQSIGSAGSFFMNPIVDRVVYEKLASKFEQMPHYEIDDNHVKIPAGWMIEQCGWKGKMQGHVGVYEHQALVLVNYGGASGMEVVELCKSIVRDVYDKFGIEIRPEVNII